MLAALMMAEQSAAQPRFEASASGGVISPGADLLVDPALGGAARLTTSGAVGGQLGLTLASGFGVEAQFLAAPWGGLEAIESGARLADTDYTVINADVLYHVSLPIVNLVLEPIVGIGGGIRRIRYDNVSPAADPALADQSDFAFTWLVGAYVNLLVLRFRLEVRDYISGYQHAGSSRTQNDFAYLLGIGIRLP